MSGFMLSLSKLPMCLGLVLKLVNPNINPVPINAERIAIGANTTLCSLSKELTETIGAGAPTIKNNAIIVFIGFILICF